MAENLLVKKLLVKAGTRGSVINAPPEYLEKLAPLPEGAQLSGQIRADSEWVQLFVKDQTDLKNLAPAVLASLKYDGVLWLTYPKRTSGISTDLNRDSGWDNLRQAGLEGMSMVSVDDTWSAFRFRPKEMINRSKGG